MSKRIEVTMVGLALAAGLVAGCGGGTATVTERLWVSKLPTKPRTAMSAFLTMRTDGDERYLGAFFQGTMLRGHHDVFRWADAGKNKAEIELLQDGVVHELKLDKCEPTTGFDYCLRVSGGPGGTTEYYSRKRWVVRKPGRKRDVARGLVIDTMLELAEDDAELAAVLDAAAEASEP